VLVFGVGVGVVILASRSSFSFPHDAGKVFLAPRLTALLQELAHPQFGGDALGRKLRGVRTIPEA